MTEKQISTPPGKEYSRRVAATNALSSIPVGYQCTQYPEEFRMIEKYLSKMKKARIDATKSQNRDLQLQSKIEYMTMWKAILIASDIITVHASSKASSENIQTSTDHTQIKSKRDIDRELLMWINNANNLIHSYVNTLIESDEDMKSFIDLLKSLNFGTGQNSEINRLVPDRSEMCEEILRLLLLKAQRIILDKYQGDKTYHDLYEAAGFKNLRDYKS